jgi:hypothetical protein
MKIRSTIHKVKTTITVKDPDTKKWLVMKNFVEQRKKRSW